MAERREIRAPNTCEPIGHYTDAVQYGDLLFVSGCAPVDVNGTIVGRDDVVAQAEQVFRNLETVLHAAGSGFEHVLKVQVLLTDVADRVRINPVRQRFFGETRPASTLIGVQALAVPEMKIEIEAVAAVPGKSDGKSER